tara:strand:- start:860 stop:1327 length:468 start_codon:yes stop_codon:yes gene_type:complete
MWNINNIYYKYFSKYIIKMKTDIFKKIDVGLEYLNKNKYFTGIMMILLNIGSRYVALDLSKTQQNILSSVWVRRALVFTIVFIATRDIKVSLLLTLMFVILISGLFNGKSRYCILPKSYIELDEDGDGEISPEEIKNAYEKLVKAGKISLSEVKL